MKRILLFVVIALYCGLIFTQGIIFQNVGRIIVANKKNCTATLVSPNVVLTAAHCVYNDKIAQYYSTKYIHFKPYSKNNDAQPVQITTYTVGMKNIPIGDFTEDALYGDWALITLEEPLGCTLGITELAMSNISDGLPLIVAGYPIANKNQLVVDKSCRYALPPTQNNMLRLKHCSLKHGDSGAPLMVLRDGNVAIVGTISAGVNDSKGRYRVFAVPSESFAKKVNALSQACPK